MKLSFVFPCLNEEETLAFCIDELKNTLKNLEYEWEIIVADNGSTDRSIEIAKEYGAQVVNVSQKGYGSALQGGFSVAKGEYVAFADCDGSYLLQDIPKMLEVAINKNADMVVASRMTGVIEEGAMPFLHRYAGTPVLTFFINLLYQGKLSDCNSGMRLFKKATYLNWNPRSLGMEFASELLIQSLKHKSNVIEISSGLRPDKRSRPPYLKTWRDGMRHLLFIFSEKPQFFECLGVFLFVICSLLEFFAFLTGPIKLFDLTLFDVHTKLLLLIFGVFGVQFYLFSCAHYVVKSTPKFSFTKRFVMIDDAKLFFLLLITGFISLSAIGWILYKWSESSFVSLDIMNPLLLISYCLIVGGSFLIGLLGIHLLKRTVGLKGKQ